MIKGIGELLVTSGVLTTQQLQEYQKEAQQQEQTLEAYLLEKKLITQEALARTYATYASVEYVSQITDVMADIDLLAKVPLKFLRDNEVMPVKINGQIIILTSNPLKFKPLDELGLLLGSTAYAVAPRKVIVDAINRYYPIEGTKQMIEKLEEEEEFREAVAFEAIDEKDILTMASEAPIIKLVNHILFQAAKRGASDIHIEPFEKELRVRYRIDGVMYNVMSPPKRVHGALVSRIKIMAHLNIAEKRLPQDGRISIKVADKSFDIRVSVLPTAMGERVVMRLLDKTRTFASLDELGLSERDFAVLKRNIERSNGIFYVTGPTGSGKTTTLYSILAALNKPEVNIVTVEDPVEYQMPGIGQVQVKEQIGMTFAAALRAILRQDPDIIMIGETRDQETAHIAVQSALTGHLVFSTLHTNNAPASITRLLDMAIEPFLIASSVIVIVAQRLVRKLCDACRQQYSPSVELIKQLGLRTEQAKKIIFYQATGCQECLDTGYKGRLAIFEFMEITDGIARLIMERADASIIRKQAIRDGMTLLLQDGVRKIEAGLTTIEEVLSVTSLEHIGQE